MTTSSIAKPMKALAERVVAHAPAGAEFATSIPGLSLSRFDAPTQPSGYLLEPSVCVVLQGSKCVLVGDEEHTYEAGQFFVTAIDLPLIARIERASPSAPYVGLVLRIDKAQVARLVLEQRRSGPSDLRRRLGDLLGEMAGGLMLILTPRLDEQAMETEQPGLRLRGECLERGTRLVAVAGKLRRLGGQQQRHRLRAEKRAALLRGLAGGTDIACANGDHPVGEHPVAAIAAAAAEIGLEGAGRPQDRADHRPQDRKHHEDRGDGERRHHQRRPDLVALPVEGDVARPVGEPRQPGRYQEDERYEDQYA